MKVFKIDLDEPVDAVIYMSGVATGFGLIENLAYGWNSLALFGVRSFLTTPLHIIFSISMALSFSSSLKNDKDFKLNLFRAYLIAVFLHASYDALLVSGIRINIFILSVVFSYFGTRIFRYTLLNSPHRKSLQLALLKMEKQNARECLVCSTTTNHEAYQFRNSTVHACTTCEHIILPKKQAVSFIGYFLPFYLSSKSDHVKKQIESLAVEIHDRNYNVLEEFILRHRRR